MHILGMHAQKFLLIGVADQKSLETTDLEQAPQEHPQTAFYYPQGWRLSGLTPWLKEGHPEPTAQDNAQIVPEYL